MEMRVVVKRITRLRECVEELLEELEWRRVISPRDSVIIKPNFLTAPRAGVTTDLELLSCVASVVKERAGSVAVVETDSTGRDFDSIAEKLSLGCAVVNLSKRKKKEVRGRYGSYSLPELALNSRIVNLPVLKTHVLTRLTLAVKNLFGLLPEKDKEPYHWGISRTLCDLYGILKPEINILDATYVMDGEGPSEGRVRRAGFLLASRDALALDLAVCELIGMDAAKIEHLGLAMKHYPAEYEIEGDDVRLEDFRVPEVKLAEKLAALLQHSSMTRRILRQPLIRRGARRIKRAMRW
jgi:uncharacterized protein (DUF362 family)